MCIGTCIGITNIYFNKSDPFGSRSKGTFRITKQLKEQLELCLQERIQHQGIPSLVWRLIAKVQSRKREGKAVR